ncbi:Hypothetical_protein [Hexamita inflata]|uniref:Hypothetical_protein n=1 Tax=Hexamita inflata TaxID=28002 RepID=A0AA86UZG0_9EUKA|nr:Hypothetical protein HINF_LOCUS58186 [Hexamita inflata]
MFLVFLVNQRAKVPTRTKSQENLRINKTPNKLHRSKFLKPKPQFRNQKVNFRLTSQSQLILNFGLNINQFILFGYDYKEPIRRIQKSEVFRTNVLMICQRRRLFRFVFII